MSFSSSAASEFTQPSWLEVVSCHVWCLREKSELHFTHRCQVPIHSTTLEIFSLAVGDLWIRMQQHSKGKGNIGISDQDICLSCNTATFLASGFNIFNRGNTGLPHGFRDSHLCRCTWLHLPTTEAPQSYSPRAIHTSLWELPFCSQNLRRDLFSWNFALVCGVGMSGAITDQTGLILWNEEHLIYYLLSLKKWRQDRHEYQ